MSKSGRRLCYSIFCVFCLIFWLKFGIFEAIEAPYVGF